MNSNDQTSLKQLYQQRKNTVKAPAALTQSLLKAKAKRSRLASWSLALPTVVASLLVVVVIWPNAQTTLDSARLLDMSEQMSVQSVPAESDASVAGLMALEASVLEETEQTESVQIETVQLETVQLETEYAEPAVAKIVESDDVNALAQPMAKAAPAPMPAATAQKKEARSALPAATAPMTTMAEKPAMPAQLNKSTVKVQTDSQLTQLSLAIEDTEPEALMVDSAFADEIVKEAKTVSAWVNATPIQVVNGETGEYKDCQETVWQLDVKTDYAAGTWLEASYNEQTGWQISVLEASPCLK